MAKSIQNVVMQGASGKIGKTLVFRNLKNGDTVIANRGKLSGKPLSPDQEIVIDKFKVATYTAKIFAKDPILGPQYLAKAKQVGKSAYIVAMRDCLTPPTIKTIDLSAYNGTVGNIITVRAVDDFKVAAVKIRILKANGVLVEQGNATIDDLGLYWIYVATTANTALSGTKVEVTATDMPGNETIDVKTI